MPRKKGYQRARLLRGKEPGSGREAAPDGLDRSDPDGLAPLADAFLLAQQVKNYSDRTLDTRRYALTIFLQWAQDRELKRPEDDHQADFGKLPAPLVELPQERRQAAFGGNSDWTAHRHSSVVQVVV